MQFTSIALATFAIFSSTLAAPNDLNARSAANTLSMWEEKVNLAGGTLFPSTYPRLAFF